MKNLPNHSLTKMAAVAAMSAITICSIQAQIISDDFTGTNGTLLSAHTPNTDLPGSSYIQNALNGTWLDATIQSNTARLNTDMGVGISIASSGGYTKPTSFTISADLNLGTVAGADNDARGVGLGFFSILSNSAGHGTNNFLGLALLPSGKLNLVSIDGTPAQNITLVQSFNYNGLWSAVGFHSLSYNVNTGTGNISNVVLDGTSYAFNSTNLFTNAATANAGFYASAVAANQYGYFDNFNVVPEPGTIALLGLGFTALLVVRKRKV